MKQTMIRNMIFDLGGVLLNLDYKRTEQAFNNLGISNFTEMFNQFHATNLFMDFETGKVSPEHFINELQTYSDKLAEDDIINAWNAMLLDFPVKRIEFLKSLKEKYRLFLLSNTNAIHLKAFQKIYLDTMIDAGSLDNCFEKAYYSHQLGMRKPDKEIYQWVLTENNLVAGETMFIDDTPANVAGAEVAGLRGVYLRPPMTIEELLIDYTKN